MHPQLNTIVGEFESAAVRLHALAAAVPEEQWNRRPNAGRWSISECVVHLNLTSTAFLPILREAIAQARALGTLPPVRYRRDLVGWLLWKWSGPPVRLRTKTTAPFVPKAGDAKAQSMEEFDRLQQEQIACVRAADGLPLERIKIRSPFEARVRYNVYSALSILPRHQQRHIWQAEQVWQGN